MQLELVLNELAITNPATNVYAARDRMTRFIQTLVRATSLGVSRVLRTHAGFLSAQLAPAYSVMHWWHDGQVDPDERRYFSRMTTKAPFIDDLPDLADVLLTNEYLFNDRVAHGLGVASFIEGLAVSIDLSDEWDFSSVDLVRNWLSAQDEEGLQTSEETVSHASRAAHVQQHVNWIDERLKTNITDGRDLWNRRAALFPNLSFCSCVRDQVCTLTAAHIMLPPTIKRLFELDRYCRSWEEGRFEPEQIPCKISPESEATLNEHEGDLTFSCPDGVNRLFKWHARMTPGAWRLHFFPNSTSRTIIIGRIGLKPFI